MKKTSQKVPVGNRMAIVYEGPRGGKYVKKDGKFVPVPKGGYSVDIVGDYSLKCDACNPESLTHYEGIHFAKHAEINKAVKQTTLHSSPTDFNRTVALICEGKETDCPKRLVKDKDRLERVTKGTEEDEALLKTLGFGGGKKAAPKKKPTKK